MSTVPTRGQSAQQIVRRLVLSSMAVRVATCSSKPCDVGSFRHANDAGHEIVHLEPRLTAETAALADGFECVCVVVNDDLGAPVLEGLARRGGRARASLLLVLVARLVPELRAACRNRRADARPRVASCTAPRPSPGAARS